MLEVNDASMVLLSSFNIGVYEILTAESIEINWPDFVRFLESCLFQFCKDQEAMSWILDVDWAKTVEDLSITTSILVFFMKIILTQRRTDVDRSIKKNCSPQYPKIVCIVVLVPTTT